MLVFSMNKAYKVKMETLVSLGGFLFWEITDATFY